MGSASRPSCWRALVLLTVVLGPLVGGSLAARPTIAPSELMPRPTLLRDRRRAPPLLSKRRFSAAAPSLPISSSESSSAVIFLLSRRVGLAGVVDGRLPAAAADEPDAASPMNETRLCRASGAGAAAGDSAGAAAAAGVESAATLGRPSFSLSTSNKIHEACS